MQAILPLETLSLTDKLQIMELLWDDLSRQPQNVASPSWHRTILQHRQQRIESGEAMFSDWHEAKQRIRERVG